MNISVGPIHYHTSFLLAFIFEIPYICSFLQLNKFHKSRHVYPDVTMHIIISLNLLTLGDLLGMSIVLQIHPSPLPPLNFCFVEGFSKG